MVYVVHGAPCSGKTTYVREHFHTGDIVCDVDRLYSALCFNEEHQSELYALSTASVLQESLFDIIRERKGRWKNAWVISLANTNAKLAEIVERVGADETIRMDADLKTCMERAKERPDYFQFIIADWFATEDFDG